MDVTTPENLNQSKLKGLFNLIKKNIFFILPVAVVLIVFSAVVYLNSTGTFSPFKALQTKEEDQSEKTARQDIYKLTPEQTKIAQTKKEVENLTTQLLDLNAQYKKDSKASTLAKLEDVAKKRKEELIKLFDSDPASVTIYALQKSFRNQLPETVKANIEEKVNLEGSYSFVIADMVDGSSRDFNYLSTTQGTLLLYFAKAPKRSLQNKIKVSGIKIDNLVVVETALNNTKVLGVTAPSPVSGRVNIAIIPYYRESSDFTNEQIENTINYIPKSVRDTEDPDDVNKYYFLSSYFDIGLERKVFDRVDATGFEAKRINGGICDFEDMLNQITLKNSGQQAAGLNNYSPRVIIHLVDNIRCFNGVKGVTFLTVPGSITSSTVNPLRNIASKPTHIIIPKIEINLRTIAHELGHAFGTAHSLELDGCKQLAQGSNGEWVFVESIIGSSCKTQGYKDNYDVMGDEGLRELSIYHRSVLGWAEGKIKEITRESQSSDKYYKLYQLEGSDNNTKGLKIPRGRTMVIDGELVEVSYYLEFRQSEKPFDDFTGDTSSTKGVIIKVGSENALWDDRNSYITHSPDRDFILEEGEEPFKDPEAGINIALEGIYTEEGKTYAKVYVTFDIPPNCSATDPTITVEPTVKSVVGTNPGSFKVTLKNNDSAECSRDFTYHIDSELPNTLVAEPYEAIGVDVGPVSPQQTAETILNIHASQEAVNNQSNDRAIYSFKITAKHKFSDKSTDQTAALIVYKTQEAYDENKDNDPSFYPTIIEQEYNETSDPPNYSSTENVCIYSKENKCFVGRYISGACSVPVGSAEGKEISCGTNTNTCVYSQDGSEITDPNDPNYNFRKGCFVGKCTPGAPGYENCTQGSFNQGCVYADGLGQEVACPVIDRGVSGSDKITVYAVSPDKDYGSIYKEELSKEDFQGGKATVTYNLSKLAEAGFKNEDEVWFCVAVPPGLRDWFGSPGGCDTTRYTYKP